jgi:hypothetical protein
MPPASSGSRKEVPSSGNDLGKRVDRLEELVRSISGDLRDVKQQQQGFGVAMLRLENSSDIDDGTPVTATRQQQRRQAVTTATIPSFRLARLAVLNRTIIGGAQTSNRTPSTITSRPPFTKLSSPS